MATIALNNNLFAAAVGQTTSTQLPPNIQRQPAVAAAATASDSVALSGTAQATLLHQQGLSVQEIATSLELTTAEVDSYLGITTSTGGGGVGGGAPAGGARAAHAAASGGNTAATNNTQQPTNATTQLKSAVASAGGA